MAEMILRHPMVITPALRAGVRVGYAYVEVEPLTIDNGRIGWRYTVRGSGFEHTGEDLFTGPRNKPLGEIAREATSIVISDLMDAAYGLDGADTHYGPAITKWASRLTTELECVALDLDGCKTGMCLTCGATSDDHTDTAHEFSHVCDSDCWATA